MTGPGASAGPEASAGLDAAFTTALGGFVLEAEVRVAPGELVAVLGPNGSGKSTLLATIAGLVAPRTGYVRLRERVLAGVGPSSARAVDVPLARRRAGLLGQEPLLFPHLTALENVAFGPRALGERVHAARKLAQGWLDRVGLAEFASRRPRELSGGQQQRVAIARTLAARPEVLLLDEPFTALDVQTAAEIRRLVAELAREDPVPTLLVTHDPLDAIVLAQRAAILHEGRIVQQGATAEVLGHPATSFVAALAGVNLVSGTAAGDGTLEVVGPAGDRLLLRGLGIPGAADERGAAVFSPAAVHAAQAPAASPEASAPLVPNRWIGTVALLQPTPGGVRITTAEHPSITIDVPSAAAVTLDLAAGARLAFTVAESDVSVRATP